MTNDLSFESGGSKVAVGFYLDSKEHVQQLGLVFDVFYRARVAFIERNRGRQDLLVSAFERGGAGEFKRKYGYT